jgi:hypothetical protein
VSIDELIRMLEDMRDRAATAAPAVALEMSRVYSVHLSRVTLRRTEAAPGQFGTPASPLSPPAIRTGALAASVTNWPGPSSGTTGRAFAGPHVIYGLTQETGAVHEARNFRYMHWENEGGQLWHLGSGARTSPTGRPTFWSSGATGGEWWKKKVFIPPRPYMEPALAEVIGDGSLQRGAALMFRSLVGHY